MLNIKINASLINIQVPNCDYVAIGCNCNHRIAIPLKFLCRGCIVPSPEVVFVACHVVVYPVIIN